LQNARFTVLPLPSAAGADGKFLNSSAREGTGGLRLRRPDGLGSGTGFENASASGGVGAGRAEK